MNKSDSKNSALSHVVSHAVGFGRVVLYFLVCLLILQTFRCTTLLTAKSENQFLTSYAAAALTAAILGKSVFILERIHITKLFDDKPVFLIIVYKTLLFTFFTDIIFAIEHLIKDHSINPFHTFGEPVKDLICFAAHQLALIISFWLFFATREVNDALGGNGIMVRTLLSSKANRQRNVSLTTEAGGSGAQPRAGDDSLNAATTVTDRLPANLVGNNAATEGGEDN